VIITVFPAWSLETSDPLPTLNIKAVSRVVKRDQTTWELHFEDLKTPITLSNLQSKRLQEVP